MDFDNRVDPSIEERDGIYEYSYDIKCHKNYFLDFLNSRHQTDQKVTSLAHLLPGSYQMALQTHLETIS